MKFQVQMHLLYYCSCVALIAAVACTCMWLVCMGDVTGTVQALIDHKQAR